MTSRFYLALALSLGATTLPLGCGDDSSASGADAATDGAVPFDSSADASRADVPPDLPADGGLADVIVDANGDAETDAAADAIADAGVPDASLPALDCLGERLPLVLSRDLPFLDVAVGIPASRGLFLLDLATTRSVIDLSAFEPRPAASGCNPDLLFQNCSFAEFDFFGPWGSVTLTTQNLAGLGGVREAGIIGTDFMSQMVLTFDYESGEIARSFALCDDTLLSDAGFRAVSTEGFYASDYARLRPLADVIDDANAGLSVPNVPTAVMSIGGVSLFVQLDTGFDDSLVPRSLNVNEAFFEALQGAVPGALTRDASSDLTLTTCAGVAELVEAWRVSEPLRIETSAAPISLDNVVLFVKRTPPAARVCGGIGTWDAPAGQLAASLHAELGALIVDPYSSRVWMRP